MLWRYNYGILPFLLHRTRYWTELGSDWNSVVQIGQLLTCLCVHLDEQVSQLFQKKFLRLYKSIEVIEVLSLSTLVTNFQATFPECTSAFYASCFVSASLKPKQRCGIALSSAPASKHDYKILGNVFRGKNENYGSMSYLVLSLVQLTQRHLVNEAGSWWL